MFVRDAEKWFAAPAGWWMWHWHNINCRVSKSEGTCYQQCGSLIRFQWIWVNEFHGTDEQAVRFWIQCGLSHGCCRLQVDVRLSGCPTVTYLERFSLYLANICWRIITLFCRLNICIQVVISSLFDSPNQTWGRHYKPLKAWSKYSVNILVRIMWTGEWLELIRIYVEE